MRVVGVELVHDYNFSRVAANLAVGASGTSRFDEQVDLRQLARNVGARGVWVAPTGRKCQNLAEKHSARVPGYSGVPGCRVRVLSAD